MNILRLIGVFAIIPTTLLLTVSFFVLFALRKLETQGLKAFGYVIASLLWVCALLVFSCGVYTISTGRHPAMVALQEMMHGQMAGMMMGTPMPETMGTQGMSMMHPGKCAGMKGQMPQASTGATEKTTK